MKKYMKFQSRYAQTEIRMNDVNMKRPKKTGSKNPRCGSRWPSNPERSFHA